MKYIRLNDINLLDVGHTIQLYGAIYSGPDGMYLIPLPDEDLDDLVQSVEQESDIQVLEMDSDEWDKFLMQSDVLDIQGPAKAILRKSQRQIDQNISWAVYRRDAFSCCYCHRDDVPLTVDHIILWEEGGASVEDNLLSCCRRCNKLRGSTQFDEWINSRQYRSVAPRFLDVSWADRWDAIIADMPHLRSLSAKKQRTR